MGACGLFVGLCMCGVEGNVSLWCFWGCFLCVFLLGLFSGNWREECRGFLLVFPDGVLIGIFLGGGVLFVAEGCLY